ncbi:ceramide synthase 6-like [Rhinatrema bivittatum]|uniref:ceramide synthase 6-like n=1 Tax=Rhinatrema bivittatum TaxID=194408 RepID=UPI0011294F1C|nr:ceramide synthase 6-like [Rhinatrema bivittatum]
MWRLLFYSWAVIYSFKFLVKKKWMWDSKASWANNESYKLTSEEFVHYVMELAFYGSLLFFQFFDIKRKDFWAMCIHHNVTILIMVSAYIHKITRLGSFCLMVLDMADVILEAGKIANYLHWRKACNGIFWVFAIVFLVSRLVLFPLRCASSLFQDSQEVLGRIGRWEYYIIILVVLQVLHLYWCILVVQMIYKTLRKGEVYRDVRSDDDDDDDGTMEEESEILRDK